VAGVEAPLQLLPGVERAARLRRQRRVRRVVIILTVALWLSTLSGFALRLALERGAVTRELIALTPLLNTTREARRSLEQAARAITVISAARDDRGGSVVALESVTAALPDSALLTSFAWRKDGSGVLSGLAKHASDVLGRMDRSGFGGSPRFEGPIVREVQAGRNWERFTIAWDASMRRPKSL
jgi:Tfp pilus assembly protein PilN